MAFTACEMVFKCTQVDANAGVLQYGMLLEEILMLIDVSDHSMQISYVFSIQSYGIHASKD